MGVVKHIQHSIAPYILPLCPRHRYRPQALPPSSTTPTFTFTMASKDEFEQAIKDAYKELDTDKDGVISKKEIHSLLMQMFGKSVKMSVADVSTLYYGLTSNI